MSFEKIAKAVILRSFAVFSANEKQSVVGKPRERRREGSTFREERTVPTVKR